MSRSRTTRKVQAIDKIGSNEKAPENGELSVTFLLGNISDLLFEIKCLAKSTSTTKSIRTKRRSVAKLKRVLGRYRNLLGHHFKEIIGEFIGDSFKSRKIAGHDLRKIQAWCLKDPLKINN